MRRGRRRRFDKVGEIVGLENLGKPGQPKVWLLTVPEMADDRDVRDSIYHAITKEGSLIRNGIVAFDDMNDYEEGVISGGARLIFSKRRQYGLEVIAMFHALRQIPPKIWTWNNFLVLWRTVENPDLSEDKTPKYEEIKEAYESLQKTSGRENRVIVQAPVIGIDGMRERTSWLFVGTNGMGKSTKAMDVAGMLMDSAPGMTRFVIFICTEQPNGDDVWRGAGRLRFKFYD